MLYTWTVGIAERNKMPPVTTTWFSSSIAQAELKMEIFVVE